MTFESRRREPSRLYRLQLSVRQKVVGPYGPTPRRGGGAAAACRVVRPYVVLRARDQPVV